MVKFYDLNIPGSEVQRRLDLASHNVLAFDGILDVPVTASDELITSAESYQILYAPNGGRGEMLMSIGGTYYRNFRLQSSGKTYLDSSWYNEDGQIRKDRLYLNGEARDIYAYADGAFGKVEKDGSDGVTPHIDQTTKFWMIGDEETGIKAEGKDGENGTDGKSAFDIWIENGHSGNISDFLAWMKDTSSMIGPKFAATVADCVMVNYTPTMYYVPNGSTFNVYLADSDGQGVNAHSLATGVPGDITNYAGIYDISQDKAVNGVPSTYGSLSQALTAFTDTTKKKGGMTIKFIQGTGANAKYVQYRLIRTTFPSEYSEDDWEIAGGVSEVVNDLVSSDSDKPLSADKGRVLAFNLQLLIDSLAPIAFNRNLPIPFVDMGVDTSAYYYTISKSLSNCSLNNNANKIAIGEPFIATIVPSSGYILDNNVIIMMGNTDITSSSYNVETGEISISSVTGNVTIQASCKRDDNIAFNAPYYAENANTLNLAPFVDYGYMVSPKYLISKGDSITFGVGVIDKGCCIIWFNNETNKYLGHYYCTQSPRTVTPISANHTYDEAYIRILFKKSYYDDEENRDNVFIYNGTSARYVFRGSDIADSNAIGSIQEYMETEEYKANYPEDDRVSLPHYGVGKNGSFNIIGSVHSPERYTINGETRLVCYKPFSSNVNTYISKEVTLETASRITFDIGQTSSNGYGIILIYPSGSIGYYNQTVRDRSIPASGTLAAGTRCRLLLSDIQYKSTAYIRIENGDYLWNGAEED